MGSAIVDEKNNNPTQLLLVKERTGGPFAYHSPPPFAFSLSSSALYYPTCKAN